MRIRVPEPVGDRPRRPSPRALFGELRGFVSRAIADPPPLADVPAPDAGTGPAVLVVPPLLRGDDFTLALRRGLAAAGFTAFGAGPGAGLRPVPDTIAALERRLAEVFVGRGKVSLVGIGTGGLFCRWLARLRPEHVRQVVTVCTPFRAPLDSFVLPLPSALRFWTVPGLAAMEAALREPLTVPALAIYSRQDGFFAPESCFDPDRPGDSAAIDAPHVAIAGDPVVRSLVLERLRKPLGPG